MDRMDKIIKTIIGKLQRDTSESAPESNMDKLREMLPELPDNPGLGGKAAPEWQKKIAPGKVIEKDIYVQGKIVVPLDPLGIVTVKIDDKVLRVHEKSMEILEILTD